jgi:hypothetical protein
MAVNKPLPLSSPCLKAGVSNGGSMRRIGALGSVLVALVAVSAAALALAPSNGAAQDISRVIAGGWVTPPTLAPLQIIMQVRRAGFAPISRPVQRGPVYVLSALDGDGIAVRLTVDAGSGRLLWVADISRTRYGGYYGYPAWLRPARPPLPPANIPNGGPDINNFGPDRTAVRRAPPLPRTRPGELTSAVSKQSAAPPQAAAPVNPDVAPAAKPLPVAPTMVPVAPLE